MKNRVEVVIAGNRFTMTGEQDEEYMTKIAALVDNRVCKVRESGANMLQAVLLTACDMADNYVQAVQGAENLRTQISGYLAENKNLSRELADAQEEINSLERTVSEKNQEMTEVNRFKDRISELEAMIEVNEADKIRINELEEKLSDTQKRMQSASVEADARHNNDLEQAERAGRELRELREKVVDGDKKQRRIEELEKELASTERQLNEVRSRLSRLLK